MNYKKEIISMIQKIESVRFLAMIYSFTHTLFEKEKNQWGINDELQEQERDS